MYQEDTVNQVILVHPDRLLDALMKRYVILVDSRIYAL